MYIVWCMSQSLSLYIYPPPCFLARERVLIYFFPDISSISSFLLYIFYIFFSSIFLLLYSLLLYLLLRDHTTITWTSRSAPPPLFDTKKPLKKQTFHNIVFLVICMSPGPQKLLQNVIFPTLGSSIFRFFSFSAELWFRTTLPWFCCFFGFRVSLFRCRRYPKPDKTHSCCSGGSEPHFQHAFSDNPSKNDIKMEVL